MKIIVVCLLTLFGYVSISQENLNDLAAKSVIKNSCQNKYGLELNNGLGYGLNWTHYFNSEKNHQLFIQTGILQFAQIYGYRSLTLPFKVGLNVNRINHLYAYLGSGITLNSRPSIKSLSETKAIYFQGVVSEGGSTFPIEQPLEVGCGYSFSILSKYYFSLSAGPYMRNLFSSGVGYVVRIQLEYGSK